VTSIVDVTPIVTARVLGRDGESNQHSTFERSTAMSLPVIKINVDYDEELGMYPVTFYDDGSSILLQTRYRTSCLHMSITTRTWTEILRILLLMTTKMHLEGKDLNTCSSWYAHSCPVPPHFHPGSQATNSKSRAADANNRPGRYPSGEPSHL
jgi:hypothetical protein